MIQTQLHVKAGLCRSLLLLLSLGPAAIIFAVAAQQPSIAAPAWETQPGYRFRKLQVTADGHAGFATIDPIKSGVLFTNILSPELREKDSTLLSGSGVALGDVDGDGLCDIYFCSLSGENKLYRNLGGWRFEDITEKAGVGCPGSVSRGAVLADLNGDGALDLIVSAKGRGTMVFLNDGKGVFRDFTAQSGVVTNTGSTSLALADIDGNGTLDLYVANFGTEMVLREGGKIAMRTVNGRQVVAGRYAKKIRVINGTLVEFGEPDVLYLNDGAAHFKALPWDKGAFLDENGQPMEAPWDYGLAVQMRDLNGDGWPDIYVCNDFQTPDRVWINDGKGHFRAIDKFAIRKGSFASMGVDFADIDRDGHPDGFIIEMLAFDPVLRLRQRILDLPTPPQLGIPDTRPQAGRNTLLWNRGDGTFAEVAEFAGLAASDWSWSPVFLDVDLDGFEDLLIGTGPTFDLMNLDTMTRRHKRSDPRLTGTSLADFPKLQTPNRAFHNLGNRIFQECGKEWSFDSLAPSTGIALADLDGDGDLDVVVNCLDGCALLLRNESSKPRIAVRLKGSPPNNQGVGSLITVHGGAVPLQSQEIISGGRYLSGDDPARVFAAGSPTNRMVIEVAWRSGKHSVVSNAAPNAVYEIDEQGAEPPPAPTHPRTTRPLFEDASALLHHLHHEEPFDDLERQPLIPRRLNQLGPGAAWWSLNGTAPEQLFLGNGRNSPLAIYQWNGKDSFEQMPAAKQLLAEDSTGMTGAFVDGKPVLLTALSNYELPDQNPGAYLQIRHTPPGPVDVSVGISNLSPASVGPLAFGDLEGDGHFELFVGGRAIPARYPQPAPSYILRHQAGGWQIDSQLSAPLKAVGLVSSAVFSDLDGDGLAELVLACERGPVRIFRMRGRQLHEVTEQWGLAQFTGLWQSVTTGDFDGDGRMDILAGNWGLNSRYRASQAKPLVLYYGDFNGDGSVQVVETQYDLSGTKLLPLKQWDALTAAMPFLVEKFPTHKAFSESTAEKLLGDLMTRASVLKTTTLSSMLFLNRGNHFEARPLPSEAQWTPIFGMGVADVDGDGAEDVVLAQNFFGTRSEAARQDAGRGLLLKGDGKGNFTPVPGQESGIIAYGQQRGCALADYDGDGRVDVVLCQNAAETRLFHNVGAAPGLRIGLRGPESNPVGLGALLRLGSGGHWGPAREIHSGAGYFSQDSPRQVMHWPGRRELSVRWPGGKTLVYALPEGALEIEAAVDGTLKVIR